MGRRRLLHQPLGAHVVKGDFHQHVTTGLLGGDDHTLSEGLVLDYEGVKVPARQPDFDAKAGESVALILRTERISFARQPVGRCALPGTLKSRHYAGGSMRAIIRLDSGREVLVLCQSGERAQGEIGDRVFLSWNPDEAPVVR